MRERQAPGGKSLRRFHNHIDRHVDERAKKLRQGKLSEATGGEGKLAIIVSTAAKDRGGLSSDEQRLAFLDEADRLADERRDDHKDVSVLKVFGRRAVDMVLRDRRVSDIVLIGHGTIGSIVLPEKGGFGSSYYDWLEATKQVDHLKQGTIEQRMCGNFPLFSSIPFGTFLVSDQRRVVAALNRAVPDRDPNPDMFQPVFTQANVSAETIRSLPIRFHRGWRYAPNYAELTRRAVELTKPSLSV